MLHFVAGVYNSLFSTPEYHVLIVGRECAGKSTLLEQLKFLYTPATQQREEAQLHAERQFTDVPSDGTLESSTSSLTAQRHMLPPGTPLRATPAYMTQKRIRPTVGLNYAVVQHRFSPPVAVVQRVKKTKFNISATDSLPLPPADIIAEQRARQQALLANAPSNAVTRIVLRDLGGQTALQGLWEKYYPQTQALVYVVDSTLPFRSPATAAASTSAPSPAAMPRDHFTNKELEEFYKPDRQLLAKVLQHPLLEDVPVLLLSNKADETPHIPLAKVQEAMRLADLAADRAFYVQENMDKQPSTTQDAHKGMSKSSPTVIGATLATAASTSKAHPSSLRHGVRAGLAQSRAGESGFGEVSMRIVEISAMDGTGVAGAMDWLVARLLCHARSVSAET